MFISVIVCSSTVLRIYRRCGILAQLTIGNTNKQSTLFPLALSVHSPKMLPHLYFKLACINRLKCARKAQTHDSLLERHKGAAQNKIF